MAIPSYFKDEYEQLSYDLTLLYFQWIMYSQIYDTNQLRIDLLNETAPVFFRDLHRMLIRDIIVGIARITDPAKVSGRTNLTLEHLANLIDPKKQPGLAARVASALTDVKLNVVPIREYRNKIVAHRDLNVAMGAAPPGVTFKQIREALSKCAALLNAIQTDSGDGATGYEHGIESLEGVPALLAALKYAAIFREMMDAREVSHLRLQQHKFFGA